MCLCSTITTSGDEIEAHQVLPDSRSLSIDEAIHATNWQTRSGHAAYGYNTGGMWLRYPIPAAKEVQVFVIDNPWLIGFDFHTVRDAIVLEHIKSGSSVGRGALTLSSSSFSFPVFVGTDFVYVYDHGSSATYFPVQLLNTTEFSSYNAKLNAFHGLYYGILFIMILYNVALFFGTRDLAYIFYSLYAGCLIPFLATADGTGALFLWGDSPEFQAYFATYGWACVMIFMAEFGIRFLRLQKYFPGWVQCIRVGQVIVGIAAVIAVVNPFSAIYLGQPILTFIALGILFYVSTLRARQGSTSAKIFVAANAMIVIGACCLIALQFGWIDPSVGLQHSVHIGSITELALFSIALAQRLRSTDRARFNAFEQSVELSRRNKELRTARALAEEHRQLQKSLQQAQKLKTIGQLAGGFAHDFNNILASILGFAELAQDKSTSSDRSKLLRYLGEIQKSGERGATLVKQLLVYSRNSPPDPRELDLREALGGAEELLRGSLPATVEIATHLPVDPIFLYIDSEQLQQMLVNLSINAAEAMNNRGKIDISLESADIKNLTCTSCLNQHSGSMIAIKVEDSGSGIKGNAAELFTPFETSKDVGQGTGLGLSVVHGIVHEHGGHIHASNRAEGGARFVIYLPHSAPPVPVESESKRILLIEDDPSVVLYLSELLDQDFSTVIANMPSEALQTFVQNPDAYDLVIANQLLPQGTGLELAEDLHALRPDLPIILTTGTENNFDANELANAGVNFVFEKPLNSDQLIAKVRGLLAGATS